MDFATTHNAREMYSRAAWTIGFAVVVYINSRAEFPGPALNVLLVLILIGVAFAALGYGLHWFATEGRRRIREQILDSLQLQGSERILSLSHDLGIEAAKRLKSGRVISLGDTAANEAARVQAKAANLGDKIRFEAGDLNKLSYPDANFDLVLTSQSLVGEDISKAVPELLRVTKPGGHLAFHEFAEMPLLQKGLEACNLPTALAYTGLPLGICGQICSVRK